MQFIKNIFGGYAKQIAVLQSKLKDAEEQNEELNAVVQERDDTIVSLNELYDNLTVSLDKHSSIVPWFCLTAEGLDPIKGIQTDMDWNEAFLQYIKESGFDDGDEFVAIQRWVAILHSNTIESIEERIIENSDIVRPSKFT